MRGKKAKLDEPDQGAGTRDLNPVKRRFIHSWRRSATASSMDLTTFEGLNKDIVCFILDKTLKTNPPGIDRSTLASFACVSSRYASLVKERGWEHACRGALPDLCEILLSRDKMSPGDAGWDCFAKLLTICPGYQSKWVNLVKVENHFPPEPDFRGLATFNVSLESHVSDGWLSVAPLTKTLESILRAGETILPGLVNDKTPFILLSNCENSPSHLVQST